MKFQPRQRQRNRFDFSRLEPRQLLAVDLGAANLVTNGDFSDFESDNGSAFFAQDDVPGWNAANVDDGQEIALFTFPTDNATALKLDSTNAHRDFVFQQIATTVGEDYVISFDLRGQTPGGGDVISETVEVLWNDELVGVFESSSLWQTHNLVVVGASGTEGTRLEFREQVDAANPNGDGVGVLIDNVNVVASTQSVLENGSFETATGEGPFFANGNVASWTALDRGGRPDLIQLQSTGDDVNIDATEGTRFLNLDTTAENVDHVFTDIATTAGQAYFVVFDVRGDGDQVSNPDEVRVRWKTPAADITTDQWVATIRPNDAWQTFGILVDGLGDLSRLEFREPSGNSGDGSGALIDDVRIYSVDAVLNDLAVDANGADDGTGVSVSLTQGVDAILVTPNLTLSHPSGQNLTSATITIDESTALAQDSLSVLVGDSGIVQSYESATGILTLTGSASVAQWQTVLQTLTYTNGSASPTLGNREISIVVTDTSIIGDDNSSAPVLAEVDLVANALQIAAIEAQTVEAGSPLWVTFDIENPADVPLQFTGASGDASILTPRFETGDSWRLNISSPDATTDGTATPLSGELTFQLFENIFGAAGSRATDRIRTLTNDGFFDGTVFHRVARNDLVPFSGDNAGLPFVIQGGDPTATGTGGSDLGDFDDQFNTLLQHNRSGLLSYAKSSDDTNDSQFFVTATDTRFLDFNHTIFGVITSGEELRASLNAVDTNGQTPTEDITITSAEIFQDNRRGAILLVAPEGVTGETTMDVTVRDANGNETTQTITVNVVAPNASDSQTNSNPFLNDIPDLTGIFGVTSTFQLTSQDVESDSVRYLNLQQIQALNIGVPAFNGDASFTYDVDPDTGLITFTPGSESESADVVQFVVGVAPETGATRTNVDLQVVTVNLSNGSSV